MALGRIGGDPAITACGKPWRSSPRKSARRWPKDASYAPSILAQGRRGRGRKITMRSGLPICRRRGSWKPPAVPILARGAEGAPLLAKELVGRREPLPPRAAGRPGASRPGGDLGRRGRVARAVPQRQSLLILALADHGEATVVPQIVQAAKTGPERCGPMPCMPSRTNRRILAHRCCSMRRWKTTPPVSQAALAVIDGLRRSTIDVLIAGRLLGAGGGHGGPHRVGRAAARRGGDRHLVESGRRCGSARSALRP